VQDRGYVSVVSSLGGREARSAVVLCLVFASRPRPNALFTDPVMEDEYYSIDSILSENQVSLVLWDVCTTPYNPHRKYNAPSRLTYPTWATSMAVASATYARPAKKPSPAPLLTSTACRHCQIKAQSKIQLPLWLAFILIYSCVASKGATDARPAPIFTPLTSHSTSSLQGLRGFYRPDSVQLARPERAQCRG
jgi:hypothetical protein